MPTTFYRSNRGIHRSQRAAESVGESGGRSRRYLVALLLDGGDDGGQIHPVFVEGQVDGAIVDVHLDLLHAGDRRDGAFDRGLQWPQLMSGTDRMRVVMFLSPPRWDLAGGAGDSGGVAQGFHQLVHHRLRTS